MRNIQAIIQWPEKFDRQEDSKDQTKWCDFHDGHAHATEDCIGLRKEIAYLNSKGHLKDIIKSNVTIMSDVRPPSPEHAKVVNYTVGSEVYCLTYSSAKRHTRQGADNHPIPQSIRSKEELELEAMKITFDQDDLNDQHQKHHDGLIVQLTVGNCITKRVLVDEGSSANVIFFDTIKAMGIDKLEIV